MKSSYKGELPDLPPLTEAELQLMGKYYRQYLFYEKDGSGWEMACTACGRAFWQDKEQPRHNRDMVCPCCGTRAEAKSIGKSKTRASLYEEKKFVLFYLTEGVLCARAVWTCRRYGRNLTPLPEVIERARYIYHPAEGNGMWKNSAWWTGQPPKWEICKSIYEPFGSGWGQDSGYEVIRGHLIGLSHLRYNSYDQFARKRRLGNCGLMKYLGEFAVRPQLEMLIKLGMDNIVSGLLFGRGPSGLNWKAKTPWGLMRLTKADWKLYMERQDIDRLPYIKKLMQTTGADFKTAEALVQGVSYRTMEFCSVLAEALKQTGESARRAQMWFGKQKRSCIYWLDYIGMAKKMGYDLTQERVAFPKDLEEAHDRVAAQVKWEEDRALEAKYAPRYERLKRVYNYTADGLEVVVPKSQSEIIAEGAALQHCVGGYARRHMEGSNTILFIRRTDALQTPFLTVQVDGERIIQVHGFRNDRGGRPAEVEYKAFLDGWLMDVHRRGVMA